MVKTAKTGQSSHPAARVGDPTEAQTRSRVPPVTEPDSWTPVVSRGTAKNNKRLARQMSWYQHQGSTRRRRNTPSDGQTPSEPRLAGRLSTVPCPVGQMPRHEPNGQTMPAGCPIGQRRSVRCPDGHGQPPPGRPNGQTMPAKYPIGQHRYECPDGRGQTPSGCPTVPKVSARCPIGHQI